LALKRTDMLVFDKEKSVENEEDKPKETEDNSAE
jgi:hypothetical protein